MNLSNVLIVTDLDATMVAAGNRVSPRNYAAIERVRAAGGFVTAATGRIPVNIRNAVPSPETVFNAPAITSNGAYIHDFATGACLQSIAMDPAATRAVAAFVEKLNPRVGMRVSMGDEMLVNASRLVPAIRRDIGEPPRPWIRVLPLAEWPLEGARWNKLVFRGEAEDLLAIRPAVEAAFGDTFEYNTSSPHFLELQAKGCNKGTGLRFLADYLEHRTGAPILTVAIGDEENDLPMLRVADIAACPANAIPAVRAEADLVVSPCEEGSLWGLVEKLEAGGREELGK